MLRRSCLPARASSATPGLQTSDLPQAGTVAVVAFILYLRGDGSRLGEGVQATLMGMRLEGVGGVGARKWFGFLCMS